MELLYLHIHIFLILILKIYSKLLKRPPQKSSIPENLVMNL